jgi:hypothetical protein
MGDPYRARAPVHRVHRRGPGILYARDPDYLPDRGPIEGKAGGVFAEGRAETQKDG